MGIYFSAKHQNTPYLIYVYMLKAHKALGHKKCVKSCDCSQTKHNLKDYQKNTKLNTRKMISVS